MRKALFLLTTALCAVRLLCAQGPTSVWTLGDSIILAFDSTSGPVVSGAHAMITQETYTTLADEEGNLLAYSNGGGVWNANHELMFNADSLAINAGPIVYGSSLSTGLAFFPIDGKENTYGYLVHDGAVDTIALRVSLRFSVLDMELDGGLGGFVDSLKSQVVRTNLTEHLHVIRHANNKDWWLITKTNDSDSLRLNVDLLSGFDVTSSRTYAFEENLLGSRGVMSSSKDGCLLGMVTAGASDTTSFIGLFRIDRETGLLTYLDHAEPRQDLHATCFSPSGRYLYIISDWPFKIWQYDLISESLDAFEPVFEPSWGNKARSLFIQRGDDDKLYFTMGRMPSALETLDDYLGIIQYPDSPGVACHVIPDHLFLQENPVSPGFLPVFPNYVRNPGVCEQGTTVSVSAPAAVETTGTVFKNTIGTQFAVVQQEGLIRVFDFAGRQRAQLTPQNAVFDLGHLPTGMYYAIQETEGKVRSQKLVIAH